MKYMYKIFVIITITFGFSFAGSDTTLIASVNKAVIAIDDSINRGEYKNLKMEDI